MRKGKATNQAGPFYSLPRYEVDENYDSDEPQWSCDLDDDDENMSFSRKLRNAQVPSHYVMLKLTKYDGRGNPTKHLNTYKTNISLRGATSVIKCRAFHITLNRAAKVWYSRLPSRSIRSWPEFKTTFLKRFALRKEGESPILRFQEWGNILRNIWKLVTFY